MGLIVEERPRAHLDADVVVGLASDEAARDYVREVRRNGHLILLSPGVVHELMRAPRGRRRKLIEAALRFCDGATVLQAPEILAQEFEGAAANRLMQPVPFMPVAKLARLMNDAELLRTLAVFSPKNSKAMYVAALQDLAQRFRDYPPLTFKAYLAITRGPIARKHYDLAIKACGIERSSFNETQGFAKRDMHALGGSIGLMSATMYRRGHGLGKGAGCMSDIGNFIEVAHSDVLLTRDIDLVECWKLVRSVITDARPEIRLVPRPTPV